MKGFGARLKKSRERIKRSQIQAAKDLGLSNVQLSRYESEDRNPDPELIAKMAEYYGVTTDYLLGRTDVPKPFDFEMKENENLFFYDLEGLSDEDKEEIKKHIEFLRFKAKQLNEGEDK